MELLNKALNALLANKEAVIGVLGFLWVFVAKAFSNINANPVVAGLQKGLDLVAKVAELVGKLCAALSEILANVTKSDGFLGKK